MINTGQGLSSNSFLGPPKFILIIPPQPRGDNEDQILSLPMEIPIINSEFFISQRKLPVGCETLTGNFSFSAAELSEETFPTLLLISKLMKVQ